MAGRGALADRFGGEFDNNTGVPRDARVDSLKRCIVGYSEREVVEANIGPTIEPGGGCRIADLPQCQEYRPVAHEPRRIVWAFARNTEAQRIAKEAGGRVEIAHSKADVVGAASQGIGH